MALPAFRSSALMCAARRLPPLAKLPTAGEDVFEVLFIVVFGLNGYRGWFRRLRGRTPFGDPALYACFGLRSPFITHCLAEQVLKITISPTFSLFMKLNFVLPYLPEGLTN